MPVFLEPNDDVQLESGLTALMLAAARGRQNIVRTLLAHPLVDPDVQSDDGQTALMFSIIEQRFDVAEILLNVPDTDLNLVDTLNGHTALHWTAMGPMKNVPGEKQLQILQRKYLKFIQAFLQKPSVEVNLRNNKKRTALMIACEKKTSRRRPRHAQQARNRSPSPGQRWRFRFDLGHAAFVERWSSCDVVFSQGGS